MSCPNCDSDERIITNVYTGKDGLPTPTITCLQCGTLEDDGNTYTPALVSAAKAALATKDSTDMSVAGVPFECFRADAIAEVRRCAGIGLKEGDRQMTTLKLGQIVYVLIETYSKGPSYDPGYYVSGKGVTEAQVYNFDSETVIVWCWQWVDPHDSEKKIKSKFRPLFLPLNQVYLTQESAEAAIRREKETGNG